MAFRKFTAQQIFDGYKLLNSGQVLVVKTDGTIDDIVAEQDAGGDIEQLDGIITPGLINCHCHLELSHLKNIIPPHTGLVDFLCGVITKRDFSGTLIRQEIAAAEKEMYNNGIVAVGDIGNTTDAIEIKSNSLIRWQNFIEVLSFSDARAAENMARFTEIAQQYKTAMAPPNRTVLTPHAPYSISAKTFELLNDVTGGQVITIHNQESPAEDELYKTGQGAFLKLYKIFGVEKSPFPVTGKSSLRSYLPHFTNGQTIFLVHNTSMLEEDIVFANQYAATNGIALVYCFCPNANLYIENRLPVISNFIENNCLVVLGTDSNSSNWQLSIAKEIQTIRLNFPSIALETILQWATSNGAKALGWESDLGSFEKGKRPGVTLLSDDFEFSKRIL